MGNANMLDPGRAVGVPFVWGDATLAHNWVRRGARSLPSHLAVPV
jgi:hypothetical protein